jgi:hypothetical protein
MLSCSFILEYKLFYSIDILLIIFILKIIFEFFDIVSTETTSVEPSVSPVVSVAEAEAKLG